MMGMSSRRAIASVAVVLASCVLSTAAMCAGTILSRTTWLGGNGNEYVVVSLPGATWDQARADLAALLPGHHLATITSQAEHDFVSSLLGGWEWWLGGHQVPITEPVANAGWTWITGEPWVYTNWVPGEPNDAGVPGREQHLAWDRGGWNDEGSAIGIIGGYVAEREAAVATPPAEVPALSALAQSALALLIAAVGAMAWRRQARH